MKMLFDKIYFFISHFCKLIPSSMQLAFLDRKHDPLGSSTFDDFLNFLLGSLSYFANQEKSTTTRKVTKVKRKYLLTKRKICILDKKFYDENDKVIDINTKHENLINDQSKSLRTSKWQKAPRSKPKSSNFTHFHTQYLSLAISSSSFSFFLPYWHRGFDDCKIKRRTNIMKKFKKKKKKIFCKSINKTVNY